MSQTICDKCRPRRAMWSGQRCPECGAETLTNGGAEWCSLPGCPWMVVDGEDA